MNFYKKKISISHLIISMLKEENGMNLFFYLDMQKRDQNNPILETLASIK